MDGGLADMVRRHDPDRFFCALFAPLAGRAALFTLYAFNHELARAPEVASEPALALIRLHWWREVLEGAVRRHEVAEPLHALLAGGLDPVPLLSMVAAKEDEVEGPPTTLTAFLDRMRSGPGALAVAAGAVLGGGHAARLSDLGAAYGVMGVLRSLPVLAAQGRCAVPLDVLAAAGLDEAAAVADPAAALAAVEPALRAACRDLLGAAAALPRAVVAAGLPGALARVDVARPVRHVPRGLGDRLAVVWAAWRGRV